MSWFRVDDKLHGHRKARRAGAEAMGLWVMCGSYLSSSESEDGRLELDEVEAVALTMRLRKWESLVTKLVEVGLWDRDGDSITFHDWADYRPTGDAELDRRRKADRLRKEQARAESKAKEAAERAAAARGPSADVSEESPRTVQGPSEDVCPHPRVGSPDPSRPVPDPLHSAGGRVGLGSPEADRALVALRSHPNLSAVATDEVARALSLVAFSSGRIALLEQAIREAAEEAAVQSTTEDGALRSLLRRYVASAKPKAGGATSGARRGPLPKQPPPEEGAKALGWGLTSTGD